jgi:hypothetical protein
VAQTRREYTPGYTAEVVQLMRTPEKGVAFLFHGVLVYTVPNSSFLHDTYVADMRADLARIYNATISEADCLTGLKPVSGNSRPGEQGGRRH